MSNVLFAKEIDEKYHRDGIRAFSLHPGGIHTNLQSHVRIGTKIFWAIVTPFFFKNKDQGAATSVFCAVSPKALDNSGEYFSDCNVEKTAHEDWMNDKALREKLWQTSEKLTGAFVSNKQ
ncbi:hypothetical protein SARC_07612 [Sphaeroforma arctica JP610]|uniref:Uncharacterized protein n=1 Tax=Sphaeroforma arctica JP610 TaxID=667725 RepID=A0A0L0FVQ1_9EUKA|nr:hypothetical protein SARC_07612 [Sphaeroforma arctica JP610]KNC80018.1 hypothetical protein SARC_07612 [Sphaeroforma arctica JP610]|eukprot:XP_014153920.1 hypothetical protein SARC_07612 [Sphaeroforma arctica JP610]